MTYLCPRTQFCHQRLRLKRFHTVSDQHVRPRRLRDNLKTTHLRVKWNCIDAVNVFVAMAFEGKGVIGSNYSYVTTCNDTNKNCTWRQGIGCWLSLQSIQQHSHPERMSIAGPFDHWGNEMPRYLLRKALYNARLPLQDGFFLHNCVSFEELQKMNLKNEEKYRMSQLRPALKVKYLHVSSKRWALLHWERKQSIKIKPFCCSYHCQILIDIGRIHTLLIQR